MKNLFTLFAALLAFSTLQAQPLPYYQDAYNESGEDLREALYDIIKVHTRLPYSSSSTDTWDVLKVSDKDTATATNVCLIYAGVSVNGPQEYNNGQGWNREHVWPQSLGGFNTSVGVGTDVHNLKPADGGLNSLRSNHEYDDLGSTGSGVNYNGAVTGNRINGSAGLFEPRDKVKGDLARIILYMDLRYEGAGTEPDLVAREALTSGGTTFAVLSTLIAWHWADPVDSFELNRNDVIHNMQGNRNPFIDHPELVHYIYGDSTNVAWNPFMAVETAPERFHLHMGPIPADTFLNVTNEATASFIITNLSGEQLLEGTLHSGKNRIIVESLPSGSYILQSGEFREQIVIAH
ncbi:MAG: endonuclease [Bacteroidetes bacterium]|nr:endonuclease [Bacteroidota bacterium]MDA0898172.1 endonuclease [Bacteroidota bacterium]